MPPKTDKRDRLIKAAMLLIHRKGFHLTTLADIAEEASVPLGNVYYYFKTKEAIGEAVIDRRAREMAEYLSRLEEIASPFERLLAMLTFSTEELEPIARYGCPVGSLCQELGKQGGTLADQAAKLLNDQIHWAEIQFKAIGSGEKSSEYALSLITNVQGILLLTHTFKDPKLVVRQAATIREWLEKVTDFVEAV